MNKQNAIIMAAIMSFPLTLFALAPIALNGGGGTPWSGGSFATASTTSASGCAAYSFASEATLGFGRAAADELCIGTTTDNKYVSIKKNGTKTQLKFNIAGSASTPHMAEYDNATTGFVVSDGTNPFIWTSAGTAKLTLHNTGSRTYLCVGAWNTNNVPCFTSDGSDFEMFDSDASTFSGVLDLGAGQFLAGEESAAAPSFVFDGGNTGFYSSAADTVDVSINGVAAGQLARSGLSAKPAAGYYLKLDAVNGNPTAGDCDGAGETGRLSYDYANHQLEVCNEDSTTRAGWDTAALTD